MKIIKISWSEIQTYENGLRLVNGANFAGTEGHSTAARTIEVSVSLLDQRLILCIVLAFFTRAKFCKILWLRSQRCGSPWLRRLGSHSRMPSGGQGPCSHLLYMLGDHVGTVRVLERSEGRISSVLNDWEGSRHIKGVFCRRHYLRYWQYMVESTSSQNWLKWGQSSVIIAMSGDHIRISKNRKDREILAPERPLTRLRLHSLWMQQTWIVALNVVYWG